MKPKLGDVLADKYRLDRVLGEGGMSTVFAAVNRLTGKQVAIKWLEPELVRDAEQSRRLLREAQAASSIDHPNVVNVFDVERHQGALFLVMELLYGEPLSELLGRGRQTASAFVKLMMPVLRGVQAAHRAGVVHRDLKPDNIFICRGPHGEPREPKVLDFGISKLASDALEPPARAGEHTVCGTPQYMAPEQMQDAERTDARSDVYALGVIFYRGLSDEYPYDADTLSTLAARIAQASAAPLHELCPGLARGLSSAIMRALRYDPAQRYPSVAAFAYALESYAGGVLFAPGAAGEATLARVDGLTLQADARGESAVGASAHSVSAPALKRSHTPRNASTIRDGSPCQLALCDPDETTVLDASEVMLQLEPTLREPRRVVPPPPPPALLALDPPQPARAVRPSQASGSAFAAPAAARPRTANARARAPQATAPAEPRSFAEAARPKRPARRQLLVLGAGLFALGSAVPLGWRAWQETRGANLPALTASAAASESPQASGRDERAQPSSAARAAPPSALGAHAPTHAAGANAPELTESASERPYDGARIASSELERRRPRGARARPRTRAPVSRELRAPLVDRVRPELDFAAGELGR